MLRWSLLPEVIVFRALVTETSVGKFIVLIKHGFRMFHEAGQLAHLTSKYPLPRKITAVVVISILGLHVVHIIIEQYCT